MLLFQALMVIALLVMGMGIALLGTIKVELARRLEIDEARIGGLLSVFGFTIIPVVFGVGYVTDELGKRLVLVAGCVMMSASIVMLALARRYPMALAGALVLGAGWSALVNVGNVLTPLAFARGGDMAAATNLANVYFGTGAFLTPLGLALLLRRATFPGAMYLVAAVALLPGLAALTVDIDRLAERAQASNPIPEQTAEMSERVPLDGTEQAESSPVRPRETAILTDVTVWLCGLAFFCYFPLEASMSGWTTSLLMDRGIGEVHAARLFSGFWLAYLGARLGTALALPAGSEYLLIVVLSAASAAVMLGISLTRGALAGGLLVLAAGFCFGPLFPTFMAVLLDHSPPEVRGRAVGLAVACGGIGSSTMPLLIGYCARRASLSRAFLITAALGAGLTLVALLLGARQI